MPARLGIHTPRPRGGGVRKLSNDQALIAFKLANRINNTIGNNQKLDFAASWSLTPADCPVRTEGCRPYVDGDFSTLLMCGLNPRL